MDQLESLIVFAAVFNMGLIGVDGHRGGGGAGAATDFPTTGAASIDGIAARCCAHISDCRELNKNYPAAGGFLGQSRGGSRETGRLWTAPHDKKKKKIVCKNTLLQNIKPGCQRNGQPSVPSIAGSMR
jgi:hypothetical protein